ncbi:oligosaccharide flippase family protein [Sulfurovum sp. XGS-02]|uniref:lipopolysaccharide biosynthesis protein n=1 Tax=Sulfurovum sp. XGS-02 TaxID=2925411 RepID=UPI00205EC062|nr:oligosaccharide flippase family protein [Sulfurovum sp. XGS-02]UPT77635.1 oligosaccharide flippase family protein [Sulfurovum sp. XGS-02]
MIKKLKPKSEFSRNVVILMTGTTIAQAIPIAISPILTRIYTPEDFGVFALFVAVASIFGSVANGRYELAIMLPRKDEDAINIFALGFIITSFISLFLLFLVILFNDYFTALFNNDEIGLWLYFVPISVLLTGLFNILNYFNNRIKNYKDIANATILKSIVLAITQLSIGFIKQGVSGLVSGQLFSQLVANTKLLTNIIKDKVLVSKISKVKILALAKRYKNFPKYSMWAALANTLSQHLTNILISTFYSISTLGFYSLVQRVLGMPAALIGGSIGQVFFQQATKEKQQTGRAIKTFNKTVKKLIMIGLPSFGILFFIVEDLFAFVFGEEWRIAGEYAQIVIPLFFIRFVVSTVSQLNSIFEKNLNGLYIQVILLTTVIGLFLIVDLYSIDFEVFLKLMTLFLFVEFIALYVYLFNLSKGNI